MTLSPENQERLEKWRKQEKLVKKQQPTPPTYVARRGDYGDDISDYDEKELKNIQINDRNPINYRYP